MSKTARERFDEKVAYAENGCWLWTASTNNDGYGNFWNGDRRDLGNGVRPTTVMVLAHRWAYEQFIGPIPDGQSVCHRCDTPRCVNPEHLFLGTQADNVRDCATKGRRNQLRFRVLTAAIHAEIRGRYTGAYGQQTALAREFGVSQPTIASIVGGRARSRCD